MKNDKRMTAISLALAAAFCLAYAGFSRQWLVNTSRFQEINFGLRDSQICQRFGLDDDAAPTCDRRSNSARVDTFKQQDPSGEYTSGAFAPLGWVTLVVSLLAAAGLLGAAGLALARKRPDLPITPTTVALLGVMVGLITGCVFVATKPGPPGYVGVGLGFWLFGIGCVLGIAGAQMLAKENRPPDPDLLEDGMNPDAF